MTAVPGKNKLTRGNRIFIDNSAGSPQDLSGDMVPGSLNGLGFIADYVDLTGESEAVANGLADRKKNSLKVKFHANDTTTTGASTVLNGIVGAVVTVLVEIGDAGAAPATGDVKFSGEFVCLGATLNSDGGKLVHDCEFQPSGSTAPAWGTK